MGSIEYTEASPYSVPQQAEHIFRKGILQNPFVSKYLPEGIDNAASKVRFTGPDSPTMPVNWRLAESASALLALEASLVGLLLERKYAMSAPEAEINWLGECSFDDGSSPLTFDSEHAQLFLMSLFLWTIDPEGEDIRATLSAAKLQKYLVDQDPFERATTAHRGSTTNIYKCADGKFFQTHGSLNPDPMLQVLGLPRQRDTRPGEEAWVPFQEAASKFSSAELLEATEKARQAGHTCNSWEEYSRSEHGRANSHVGLFEIRRLETQRQIPCWWPAASHSSSRRPLAGLKVVDLTRIIAAPAVTRGLAELGASVMRVMSPDLPDFVGLHVDLNWGKWNTYIDLKSEDGREQLRNLIRDADVVVNGYRPGVLDKYGFARDDILGLVADRDRGIILVRENCYGWYGPFKHRSGWQNTSDACVGVSHGYGAAIGLNDNEPIVTICPNSDYCTGLAGVAGILTAILQRGESGGSYEVDIALTWYNQWLIRSCGEYPKEVWQKLWDMYGNFQFRAHEPMEVTTPLVMKLMEERSDAFRDEFFEVRRSAALGVDIRCLKPAILYPHGEVQLGFTVGTRGNGRDAARWPDDLTTEIVV
jgi:crotonobetainyl-CoA:carnitine CoA-transferase CaiB-like acyl-CoA transferase